MEIWSHDCIEAITSTSRVNTVDLRGKMAITRNLVVVGTSDNLCHEWAIPLEGVDRPIEEAIIPHPKRKKWSTIDHRLGSSDVADDTTGAMGAPLSHQQVFQVLDTTDVGGG